jgi:hypothetical protein
MKIQKQKVNEVEHQHQIVAVEAKICENTYVA